jgi:hypothetical protein
MQGNFEKLLFLCPGPWAPNTPNSNPRKGKFETAIPVDLLLTCEHVIRHQQYYVNNLACLSISGTHPEGNRIIIN